jgi:hypothetical protein
MKRTTVALPEDLYALLERERRRRDVSAATVVREALEAYLTEEREPERYGFIAIGRSRYTDTSENVEELLAEDAGSEAGYNRLMYGDPAGPIRPGCAEPEPAPNETGGRGQTSAT